MPRIPLKSRNLKVKDFIHSRRKIYHVSAVLTMAQKGSCIMYDNLNNYKVFYTVARTGNISRAADTLFISQPAISKSISKLEEGLGVKLFVRTAKGVTLTDEGQLLLSHVEKAFDNISQGEDEIRRINELGIGQLKIGVSTSLCKYILLDYLQDFIVAYPHIKVIIDCHSTVNTMKLLQERAIDIGLICETEIPRGYTYNKITDIHDIFITSNAYLNNLRLREHDEDGSSKNTWLVAGNLTALLANGQEESTAASVNGHKNTSSVQTASDMQNTRSIYDTHNTHNTHNLTVHEILEKSNLMLLEKNNITRTHIDEYLTAENIHPNQILEVNNMDLLIDFASIGMGVASVVREFAAEYLASGQVIELPLETPIKKRTVGFVYADIKAKPAALSHFIEFCMNKHNI